MKVQDVRGIQLVLYDIFARESIALVKNLHNVFDIQEPQQEWVFDMLDARRREAMANRLREMCDL